MNLADNLKKIRKDNNLSQEQLAEKLGVSRQAVSKWESGISYPEMDKVIQICSLFNLNINELINEDIKEVTESKEAQVRNNKYITSFFEYITKTIDMFSSMKFKEKVKCLFEQFIIGLILFTIIVIIGNIGAYLVYSILELLPDFLYYPIYRLSSILYIIASLVLGVAILLHIFKIRYLDYYEIVREKPEEEPVEEVVTEIEAKKVEDKDIKKNKIVLEKKVEKVVIRDPKHSEYKFFNFIGKMLLWFVKLMASLVMGCFIFTLVALVMCLPIIFLIVRSGLLFFGLLLGIIGTILFNVVIVELIYNFIVSRKWNKTKVFLVSIVSLVLIGIGLGIACVSATEFNYESKTYDVTESIYEFDMNNKLILNDWNYYDNDIEYIEKDIDNIKIVVKHSDLYFANMWNSGNSIYLSIYNGDSNYMKLVRTIIDDINHKTIGIYDYQVDIYIYANKENLATLKKNKVEYNARVDNLEKLVDELYEENDRLKDVIYGSGLQVITDNNGKIIEIKEYEEKIE